jgi:hypothetical protein
MGRKRYYVIKGNVFYDEKLSKLRCSILYMPKIKLTPRPNARGMFARNVLFKAFSWDENGMEAGQTYTTERRDKTYDFPYRRDPQINK